MKKEEKSNIFYKLINIIKKFVNAIFSFLLSIFKSDKAQNKEVKSNNIIKNNLESKSLITPSTGSINEPDSKTKDSKNTILNITNDEIKNEIAKIYCKKLKIKFEDLNKEQYENFQLLNHKIVPPIRENINNNNISSKEHLQIILENKVNEELLQHQSCNKNNEELKFNSIKDYHDSSKIIDNKLVNNNNSKGNFKDNIDLVNTSVYPPSTLNTEYKSLIKLKDLNVALTLDNTYVLINLDGQIITSEFKNEIVDYQDNYLTIFKNNRYYVYKFNGDILDDTGYLHIDLKDGYYVVITDEDKELALSLDIHKYNDKNFKLTPRIPVNGNNYDKDYEVKNYKSELEVKIKSSRKTYYIDTRTGKLKDNGIYDNKTRITEIKNNSEILNHKQENGNILKVEEANNNYTTEQQLESYLEVDTIPNNPLESRPEISDNFIETNLENNLIPDTIDKECSPILNNLNSEDKREEAIPPKIDEVTNNQKDEIKPKKDDDNSEKINFGEINNSLNAILCKSKIEISKEELEDKDYHALENEINSLLDKITIEKRKTNNSENLNKLNKLELEVQDFKDNLNKKKISDINKEKDILESGIHISELYGLQTELKNIHLDNKKSLREFSLENIEDLNFLDIKEANTIQKELLLRELKKAVKATKKPYLLNLPFIRNRYFRLFTSGMLVKNHLKMFENILKKKNSNYRESNFNNMINGNVALNGALSLTLRNLNRLNYLEEMTKERFPDLAHNQDYILYVNDLKNSLLSQEEKMLRKKKIIKKYNLDSKVLIRERKRNINAA